MNSDRRPIVPRSELGRALFVAVWNKLVEYFVLTKVRLQKGSPGKFDRWALESIHSLMLRQIQRIRGVCDAGGWLSQPGQSSGGVHNNRVVLSVSNPAWQEDAACEVSRLQSALGDGAEVHHIGSTAIERLMAKPIIDLAITLPAENFGAAFGPAKAKLDALGYHYLGVRGGHFFEKATASVRSHALQVHPTNNPILAELLRFRDALRRDEVLRGDYEKTKQALAAYFPDRRLFYVFYKSHWIDDWQWRHSGVADWTSWFLNQKRSHAQLARMARHGR